MAQEHRNRGRICIWRVGFAAITLLLAKGFVRGRCIFLRLIEDRSSLLPGTRIRHAPIAGLFWPWKVICKYWHPSFFNIWAWNLCHPFAWDRLSKGVSWKWVKFCSRLFCIMKIDELSFCLFFEVIASRFSGALPKSTLCWAWRIEVHKYFVYQPFLDWCEKYWIIH